MTMTTVEIASRRQPLARTQPHSARSLYGGKRGGVYNLDATGDLRQRSILWEHQLPHQVPPPLYTTPTLPDKAGPHRPMAPCARPRTPPRARIPPDGLKWTVKLNPNVKFHNIAPVNGRAMTSEDIKAPGARNFRAVDQQAVTPSNRSNTRMPSDRLHAEQADGDVPR